MQNPQNTRLQYVLDTIKSLEIRFPVAEIVQKTGFSKSQVSSILNEKIPVSDNFLKKFKECFPLKDELSTLNEPPADYLKLRRDKKNGNDEEGIIYVPVSAQAGYSKRVKDSQLEKDFEKIYIPGLKYKGAKYRMFEVEGDSMNPTLKEGMQVICEIVESEGWQSVANYYMYVLVSDDMITIKRIFRKTPEEWVLISDNEDFYDQVIFNVKNLKELWKVKRKLDWDMAPPKKFEIKL